jgi:hypothetical protein
MLKLVLGYSINNISTRMIDVITGIIGTILFICITPKFRPVKIGENKYDSRLSKIDKVVTQWKYLGCFYGNKLLIVFDRVSEARLLRNRLPLFGFPWKISAATRMSEIFLSVVSKIALAAELRRGTLKRSDVMLENTVSPGIFWPGS